MSRICWLIATLFLLVASLPARGDEASQARKKKSYYLIGNSLTWDTVPPWLDGDTQWHVDCGKSLPFMVANPEKPCVKSSTLWPKALTSKQYDVLAIQVHYGSTLAQDIEAISRLIDLQPKARVVIHTGWARAATRNDEWKSKDDSDTAPMSHNRAWFEALLTKLRKRHPQRSISRTRAIDLLQRVDEEVAKGAAPITETKSLYRDKIHMNVVTGRYLMHNAMRHALGQPRTTKGFEKLDPKMKSWMDSILEDVLQDSTSSAR